MALDWIRSSSIISIILAPLVSDDLADGSSVSIWIKPWYLHKMMNWYFYFCLLFSKSMMCQEHSLVDDLLSKASCMKVNVAPLIVFVKPFKYLFSFFSLYSHVYSWFISLSLSKLIYIYCLIYILSHILHLILHFYINNTREKTQYWSDMRYFVKERIHRLYKG